VTISNWIRTCRLGVLSISTVLLAGSAFAADHISGQVLGGGAPIAKSTVTLWEASSNAPKKLAETKTNDDGKFEIRHAEATGEDILYLVAIGGEPKANKGSGDNGAIGLLTVLGNKPPERVVINEYTTIASVWTSAQFINGSAIQGTALGLRIAARNVPNFVDLETGGYGVTIQDGLNSTQTPTMANFSTLANVLAGCVMRVTADACEKFFAAATPPTGGAPKDTLAAGQAIARNSAYHPERVFALLNEFYPVPKGKQLRSTPYMPYLNFAPSAWVLPLKFTGGGLSGAGKLMIDSEGNAWVGDNFLVGAQNQDAMWAGNLTKFAPNGKPLSPMTSGFTGGGMGGIGFGLAIDAHDKVWATSFGTHTISLFDKMGKPLSPPDGYNFGGRLGNMQGVIVTPRGDVWAVDEAKFQLIHFPEGDPSKGELLCQNKSSNPMENPCKLLAPFHLAIDQQDRIWVTGNLANWVTRFPASDPTRVETFKAGYSGSGLAIDSLGNVWITNRLGSSEKGRASLGGMFEAIKTGGDPVEVLVDAMVAEKPGPEGGSVTVLRPDGTEASFSPITGQGLAGPWAVSIDGNDNVWVSNLVDSTYGIVQLCGFRTEHCPPGMKTGDAISPEGGYVGGGLQLQVDVGIGPAGDVWVTNNWQYYPAQFKQVPEALSTLGAGQGVVVFFGMAKPVRTPLIGPPRQP
jgi:hypothetical protein